MQDMTNTDPGPRPSDPSKISFARECFVADGEHVEYMVCRLAPNYPARFATRDEAEAFARVRRGTVSEHRSTKMRRVRWY